MTLNSPIAGRLRVGAFALALLAAPSVAFAGSCPVDKLEKDVTVSANLPAKGVTDVVLAMIDVAKEPAKIEGRLFRIRRLEVQPGGVVPWHSHGDRPALIYIVKGEMVEHASNCALPIRHKAGEVARETHVTSHWWENKGNEVAVLISVDLAPKTDQTKGM